MTILVFSATLLGAMALGLPIAFALMLCALALMAAQGQMDATILSQKLIGSSSISVGHLRAI